MTDQANDAHRNEWLLRLQQGAPVAIKPRFAAPRLATVHRTTPARVFVIEAGSRHEISFSRATGRRPGQELDDVRLIEPTPDVLAEVDLDRLRQKVRRHLDFLRSERLEADQCRRLLELLVEFDPSFAEPAA